MKKRNIVVLTLLAGISLPAMAQYEIIDSVDFKSQTVDVGANRTFTREQSSASVSVITNKDVNHRGASNIGNNLIGQGNGLVALQGAVFTMWPTHLLCPRLADAVDQHTAHSGGRHRA